MNEHRDDFTGILRRARRASRLSQLDLALRLGVSQRHVSFVESGRSRPSRSLLAAWLGELDSPPATRNAAMVQAGYAPLFSSGGMDDPALAAATQALGRLLDAHDPMPAFVLDADWTIVRANRGGLWLAGLLMPGLGSGGGAPNMLDAFGAPGGLVDSVLNLDEVGPAMLVRLRREVVDRPTLAPRVAAFERLLAERLGSGGRRRPPPPPDAVPPLLTPRFRTPLGDLGFFTMFTSFGAPQDVTLASLRVEHLVPADHATAAVVRSAVGGQSASD